MPSSSSSSSSAAAFVAALLLITTISSVHSIGVNYGTQGDNLPPPTQVAQFLKSQTLIDRIKIFDVNPDILRAFAGSGILVAVTIPNGEIPALTNLAYAQKWLATNILPFHPQTKINYILVGSEVLHWGPQLLVDNLVAAVRSVHQALRLANVTDIKVTTAHSLGLIASSEPPSLAKFRPGWDKGVLAPLLQYHRESKTPFMVNPYPFFGYSPEKANFSLFLPNKGVFDKFTRRTYGNMYDMLIDAVYVSMMKLGYKDVEIAVGETGWSSLGDNSFEQMRSTVANAAAFNGGLVRKYNAGRGTPLLPKRKIETYVFGLFNENLKSGPFFEKNFGLFRPDFSTVYDVGLLRTRSDTHPPKGVPTPSLPPSQGVGSSTWCVPKPGAADDALQANIDWLCSQGMDCTPIQPGGPCFDPNTVRGHASFVMNAYYQKQGRNDYNCFFSGTGVVTSTDPSYGTCKYLS